MTMAPRRTEHHAAGGRLVRWGQWAIIVLASVLAWGLFIMAAVLHGAYLVLLFPSGWCVYVAVRQYRLIHRRSRSA